MTDKIAPENEILMLVTNILNKNLDVEEKLNKSICDLSDTLTQVRISIVGIQGEIKLHSESIQGMKLSIDEIRTSTGSLARLQSQLTEHIQWGQNSANNYEKKLDELEEKHSKSEKRLEIFEKKIECVDSKSKIDLVKVGVNFFLYFFGGSGLFALLFWIFNSFILNK